MKLIIFILLIVILFFTLSFYFFVGNINSAKKEYESPICGDSICESSEELYCLDCNLSCRSELCNSKINVICDNCSITQKELLPVILEHQTIAYDCLSDYYGYYPPRLVYHTISKSKKLNESCSEEYGCYVSGGSFSNNDGIKQSFITGTKEYGEIDVIKKENVGFEIHELAHAFTYYGLGKVPEWFAEGISIYSESRILCHFKDMKSNNLDDIFSLYNNSTDNTTIPPNEYEKTKKSNHVIGARYFGYIEQNYNCDRECVAKILHALQEYKNNCLGSCFEEAKKSSPELENLSLNNSDLRVQIITNKLIKQKSEEILNKDLTELFKMLEIEY